MRRGRTDRLGRSGFRPRQEPRAAFDRREALDVMDESGRRGFEEDSVAESSLEAAKSTQRTKSVAAAVAAVADAGEPGGRPRAMRPGLMNNRKPTRRRGCRRQHGKKRIISAKGWTSNRPKRSVRIRRTRGRAVDADVDRAGRLRGRRRRRGRRRIATDRLPKYSHLARRDCSVMIAENMESRARNPGGSQVPEEHGGGGRGRGRAGSRPDRGAAARPASRTVVRMLPLFSPEGCR